MRRTNRLAGGACVLLLAGCAAAPKAPAPAAAPPPPPPPVATPQPLPPAPAPAGWEDREPAAGDWRYLPSPTPGAEYGEAGAAALTLRCDAPRQRLTVARTGAGAGAVLTVRTTFGSRALPVEADGVARLAATDPLLDEIVSSRGRIALEAAGLPTLILPTWPEPARAVEECRG